MLSFNLHFKKTTLNGKRMAAINRQFCRKFNSPELLVKMFKIYSLPQIEFGSMFWTNNMTGRTTSLESHMRNVIRRAVGGDNNNMLYDDRLIRFNFISLNQRLELQLIITGMKIYKNLYWLTPFIPHIWITLLVFHTKIHWGKWWLPSTTQGTNSTFSENPPSPSSEN